MVRLSIITINYNNKEGLYKTIHSVFEQSVSDFEYLIIDGGSVDGSVDIIRQHSDRITYWASEKDNGVYHAMNKGVARAKGEYLLFLNSGDVFNGDDILEKCFSSYDLKHDLVFGDLIMEMKEQYSYKKEYPETLSFLYFFNGESLPHPATFIRKELFEKVGLYNEELSIVSDWEFWMKALFLHSATYLKLPYIISVFNLNGMSSDPKNINKQVMEKQIIYAKYFSNFINDYNEYSTLKNEYSALKGYLTYNRLIKILRKVGFIKIKLL